MLVFINLLAILWTTVCLLFSIKYIVRGKSKTINIIYIVFYIFFVIPVILDIVIGRPNYYNSPGFYLASRDEVTSIIYAIYISIIPLIWRIFSKSKSDIFKISIARFNFNIIHKILLNILAVSPIIGLLFSPDLSTYINYAASPRGLLSVEGSSYHILLSRLSLVSIIAIFLLLMIKKKIYLFSIVAYFPLIFFSVWIHGKRSIVMITILLFTYLLWNKKILRGFNLVIYGILIVTLFILFSNSYQTDFRYSASSSKNLEYIYENFRIDYGRDDVTKLAIYAELNPNEVEILEYRFQSFLFSMTGFIPRSWWPEKPYPYDYYLTSAVELVNMQILPYKMTSSILDESIANLSWLGMLIGPLIIFFICRIGDSTNSAMIRLLTILVASLLLAVQLISFIVYVIMWLILVIFNKSKYRIVIR